MSLAPSVLLTLSLGVLGEGEKEAAHGVGSSPREPSKDGGKREKAIGGEGGEDSDERKTCRAEEDGDGADRADQKTCGRHGTDRYVPGNLQWNVRRYLCGTTIHHCSISDHRSLPELKRLPGLKLSGQAFADIVMVFEFLHNFGETLGFGELP